MTDQCRRDPTTARGRYASRYRFRLNASVAPTANRHLRLSLSDSFSDATARRPRGCSAWRAATLSAPKARMRTVAMRITRHHGEWAANAIVTGINWRGRLARLVALVGWIAIPTCSSPDVGLEGAQRVVRCLPMLADSLAASIRTSPELVALPWSTADAG